YRQIKTITSGSYTFKGLYGDPASDTISFAEIIVLNSNNDIVQCGTTNEDGTFQVSLPKNLGDVRLKVMSRAFNSMIKVSILEDNTLNAPYSIEKGFNVSSSNVNIGALTAYARQSESSKMEGAAFNILKDIYKANSYVRTQTSNSSWVADKVSVYWKAGFNPYSYFGYPDSPLSFYRPGAHELYILGGYNGNVNTSDTDHFDNSVIIHEYGHFLEDIYGKTDSPGGYHNGDAVIDPRLAWSEGWANFFQAAVFGNSYYVDTSGFCGDSKESGSCSQNVFLNLSEDAASASLDRMPSATPMGEGNFREVSISRTLYKIISPASNTTPLGAGIPFKEIWNIFSDGTTGFHASAQAFRSSILLNKNLDLIISASYSSQSTYWNNILDNEKQNKVFKDYANTFNEQTLNSCTAGTDLSPVVDKTLCSGTSCPFYKKSNQLKSNDFYRLDISQSDINSNATIYMDYTQLGSPAVDLDIYLYKQDYTYFEEYQEKEKGQQSDSIVKESARSYGSIENGYESITLGGLSPGVYMLVVKANTLNKTSSQVGYKANYKLHKSVNSTQRDLCPAN
ncbi:MAG: hypothetical protein KDD45_12780, partial [Bdellovibrionales bacterium]|nr:hypothetical protein [Bdellovibrionales bacterium]